MHRNLRIYRDEVRRSHVREGMVATVWAILFVGMFVAAALQGGHPKLIETANISAAPGALLH